MTENINLLKRVESFQKAVNQHNVDKVMTMFTEDAKFEIVGLSTFSGKKQVKNIFEYDVGVNMQLQFINCKSEGNIFHCQILERNDRLDVIGISELKYSSRPNRRTKRRVTDLAEAFCADVDGHLGVVTF